MTFPEILEKLNEGKAVRREKWIYKEGYIKFDKYGNIVMQSGVKHWLDKEDLNADDWEEFVLIVDFNIMIKYLKNGKKARNIEWGENMYLAFDSDGRTYIEYKNNNISDWCYHFDDYDIESDWIIL